MKTPSSVAARYLAGEYPASMQDLTLDLCILMSERTKVVSGSVKDNGPAWTPLTPFLVDESDITEGELSPAPATGKHYIVDDIILSCEDDQKIIIQSEDGAFVPLSLYVPARSVIQITPRSGITFQTNAKIMVLASNTGNVGVMINYHQE